MKIGLKTVAMFVLPGMLSGIASADIITYQLSAQVYDVYDPDNVLQGKIKLNDTISGSYGFDSSVPNTSGNNNYGFYDLTHSTSPGFQLEVNQEILQTDPTVPGFMHMLDVGNDISDYVHVGSWGNSSFSNGAKINDINMDLYNDSGSALNGIVLGVTPPDINAFNFRDIYISGTDSSGYSYFSVLAKVLVLTDSAPVQNPDIQKFQLDATVMDVWDPANILAGSVSIGAALTGSYAVNITVPDEEPAPEIGRYPHTPGLSEFGLDLSVGGMQFTTDSQNGDMWVELYEGGIYGGGDSYSAFSKGGYLSNGMKIEDISIYIYDNNGTMLSSDVLRDNAPKVPSNGFADVNIYGRNASGTDYFYIRASLQNISPWQADATKLIAISPSTDNSFDPMQRFDTAVIFDASVLPIFPLTIFVNGVEDPALAYSCFPGAAEKTTWVCSDFSWLLGAGANTVTFRANLMDGTTLSETVQWNILQPRMY